MISKHMGQHRWSWRTTPVCVIKPDGEPAELLAGVELQSDNNMDSHVRCLNCHKRKRQYGTMWNSGHVKTVVCTVTPVVRTVAADCESISPDCDPEDTTRGYGANAPRVDFEEVCCEYRHDCPV